MFESILLAQAGRPSMQVALTMAICTMIASLIGFGIGYWYGKNNLRWQFKKLAKDASKLLPTVLGQLDAAEQACRRLQALPKLNLNNTQTEQLEHKQAGLIDCLGQLLARLKPELNSAKAAAKEKEKYPLKWQLEPVDYSLEIPDSTTIMPNLKSLVCYLKQYQRTGGFLLLKMNKKDTFKDRFGPASTEDLFKQLGALARASLRENDLIARVEDDVLGLFLPDTDMDAGTEFANQLRHTIRHGSFRLHSNESEVMLTASLGYTFCGPTDTPDLVMSRALKTLKSSESRGRNQLFVHSGKSSPRCISSN